MKILVAGASGFIGSHLVSALSPQHEVILLGRRLEKLQQVFPAQTRLITWSELSSLDAATFDVVINLSGYNISERRWSAAIKQELIDSRVKTNQQLSAWLIKYQATPHFISANAVGIYGVQDRNDLRALDENTAIDVNHPKDFLNEIGIAWQQSLRPAIEHGIPVTTTRFGVVLKRDAGLLKKLQFSFNLGLGGIIGDGQQVISWVHMDDVIGALLFLIEHPDLLGPVNVTAPNPIPQKVFAKTLGHVMHRPVWFWLPANLIRVVFGEMGDCLLLSGQRVLPKRLLDAGYVFRYPNLITALQHEFL